MLGKYCTAGLDSQTVMKAFSTNTLDSMYFGVNIVSFKVVSSVEETTDLSMGEGKIAGAQAVKAILGGGGEERRKWKKRRQIL